MPVAAMQSMAQGRATKAHAAYAGRDVNRNSISGSLPTEIGQLSSLVYLYGPLSLLKNFSKLLSLCKGGGTLCWWLLCRAWHGGGQAERMLHLLAGMSTRTASQARCPPRSASSADLCICTAPLSLLEL